MEVVISSTSFFLISVLHSLLKTFNAAQVEVEAVIEGKDTEDAL